MTELEMCGGFVATLMSDVGEHVCCAGQAQPCAWSFSTLSLFGEKNKIKQYRFGIHVHAQQMHL